MNNRKFGGTGSGTRLQGNTAGVCVYILTQHYREISREILLCKLYQVGRAPVCDCGEAIVMSEEETGETQHIFQPLFVFILLLVCNLHNIPFVNV